MVSSWDGKLNWGQSPPEDHIDTLGWSIESHGTPIMCIASFHAMGTFNTLISFLIAPHYSQDDALGPVCPSRLSIYDVVWQLIQGREEVCLSSWDMGGQAPSLETLVLEHYRLFYHQETHETNFCAPNINLGPTWWFTGRVRGHPLVRDLWSPLTHFGTRRTQCCLPMTLHQHDVIILACIWVANSYFCKATWSACDQGMYLAHSYKVDGLLGKKYIWWIMYKWIGAHMSYSSASLGNFGILGKFTLVPGLAIRVSWMHFNIWSWFLIIFWGYLLIMDVLNFLSLSVRKLIFILLVYFFYLFKFEQVI